MSKTQNPAYWQKAIKELSENDSIMAAIIARYSGETLQGKDDAFHTLMRSVTGQQISVKAADAIWGRLENACNGQVAADIVRNLSEDVLRAIGYSRMKCSYLHSLADFFLARKHLERDWAEMSDEEVIKDITQIKGIGVWTAEMFLIFHLLRSNILPLGDLGLVNAIARFYNDGEKLKPQQMRDLAKNWQPYCSVATWYLWRALDDDPVAY